MGKKYVDSTWDFRTANTKVYTHCLHPYPAMMIPQIADRLLEMYGKKCKFLFDPYCGTGTSLVQANLRGIEAIGSDINPLARLISKTATTIIPTITLSLYSKKFSDFLCTKRFGDNDKENTIRDFPNINFWFKKDVKERLAVIKKFIASIEDNDVSDFFKVAFSETVREVSFTKNGEFKLVRMPEKKMKDFDPDVYTIMETKILRNINGLKEYTESKKGNAKTNISDFNSVLEIPEKIVSKNSIDIIITSPPYGDSRTTVAYGQFSRLANQWLEVEDANQVDKISMGGSRKIEFVKFNFLPIDNIIEKIGDKDKDRALDVISFYLDYEKSIKNIANVVKVNGIVVYVVGNRKVKGYTLPTDEITVEFFNRCGFEHIETIIREIPNKRMPSKNSPTNETGITDNTMNNEYITIFRKV